MITDSQILIKGMESLVKALGIVECEKFISLILRESSDYTKWRKDLFKGMSLNELNKEAKAFWEKEK